ncbi:threonine/serine exporter ThrE family protein [Agromyces sp. NPDC056965]|uniref:threonine/serine ThrE exporter family protein n=1 Tax=Agromyces sp. NPDC056965 TaxID=3345983 RepID=UPI0036313880
MSAGGRVRIVIAIFGVGVAVWFGIGGLVAAPIAAWAAVSAEEPVPTEQPVESTPPPTEPEPEPTPTVEPVPTEEPAPTDEAPATEAPATETPPPPTETPSPAPVLEPVPPAVLDDTGSPWSWIIAALVLLASAAVLFAIRRPGATEAATETGPLATGVLTPGGPAPGTTPPPAVTLAAMESVGEAMIDAGYSVTTVHTALLDIATVNAAPATEIIVFPTALIVSARGVGELSTGAVASGNSKLTLSQIDELNRTVEAARTGAIDPATTKHRIRRLREQPLPYSPVQRVVAYALLSTGLSVLLGASWAGAGVAAVLGVFAGAAQLLSARASRDYQALVTVAIAFGVSIAVFLLIRAGLDPGVLPALIAPLVTLLPGSLLTTGVIELATGQMMSGGGRLAAGTMQLVLLAVGIVGAAALVGVPRIDFTTASQPIGPIAPWIAVAVFGVGIVVYNCGRRDSIIWILLVLYSAYGAQVIGDVFLGGVLSAFVGALVMTPVAVLVARQRTGPPAVVSFLPAFWLLVPGAIGLVGVATILGGDQAGADTLVTTASTMVAIALGILAGSAVTARLRSSRGPLL